MDRVARRLRDHRVVGRARAFSRHRPARGRGLAHGSRRARLGHLGEFWRAQSHRTGGTRPLRPPARPGGPRLRGGRGFVPCRPDRHESRQRLLHRQCRADPGRDRRRPDLRRTPARPRLARARPRSRGLLGDGRHDRAGSDRLGRRFRAQRRRRLRGLSHVHQDRAVRPRRRRPRRSGPPPSPRSRSHSPRFCAATR